ncbi:MAG: DUF4405 domain-containing protein [candidate division Zixibacteria bacterium]|nr:DUF4405 domain-containing protein [candidate division Zixibacteria bacterium]MDH3935928.1 DUF4405 domain-containing protein [candidate division Zixibacteria bacterium]MDH4032944.1 DUF4405 domain-containing protein [candidate division Zixibacteria bacterium]
MAKDTSKPMIHSATTYKLYLISCIVMSSGLVLLLKFPEMQLLDPAIDPISLSVYGLSMGVWKIVHFLSSIAFVLLTALHMYFNKDWIKKVGSKKLNLNVVVGILIGVLLLLAGILAPSA